MEGPPFLNHPEDEWLNFEENSKQDEYETSKEMLPNKGKVSKRSEPTDYAATTEESSDTRQSAENPLLEHLMETCSTFTKARKTLAYVRRFINNTRKKEKKRTRVLFHHTN